MKPKFKMILTVAFSLLILSCTPILAAEYYIDYQSGNDSRDGLSATNAWKHCPGDSNASGLAGSYLLQPGDVFYFKKGVIYYGLVAMKRSGNSSNPIRYTVESNYGSGDAVIDGTTACFLINGYDYITIDGLKLISTSSHTIDFNSGNADYITVNQCIFEKDTGGYAIRLNYSANITITNNTIYLGSNGWGIYTLKVNTGTYRNNHIDGSTKNAWTSAGDALVVSGSNLLIENNEIYDLMNTTSHSDGIVIQGDGDRDGNPTNNVTVRNNKVRNATQCIYLDAIWGELQNVKIYGNVIWSTPQGEGYWQVHGISIDPEDCSHGCGSGYGWSMPGLEVYNNTVYVNGMGIGDGTRNAPNVTMGRIKNNIIIQKAGNNEQAYRMRDNPAPVYDDIDNNWVYSDGSGQVYKWISTTYNTSQTFCTNVGKECSANSYAKIEATPGQSANFANLASYNFHPTSFSPFIDKGVSYSTRTTDHDGKPIIGMPDMGAYEYQGAPSCTDNDSDGYGATGSTGCQQSGVDCNDSDASMNPGANEICDGKDNDCDGTVDEGCDATPPSPPSNLQII